MSLRQFSCGATTRRLHARAEGRLTPAELLDLDRHLAGCEACRRVADGLAWTAETLARGRRALPSGLADRIVREVSGFIHPLIVSCFVRVFPSISYVTSSVPT